MIPEALQNHFELQQKRLTEQLARIAKPDNTMINALRSPDAEMQTPAFQTLQLQSAILVTLLQNAVGEVAATRALVKNIILALPAPQQPPLLAELDAAESSLSVLSQRLTELEAASSSESAPAGD